MNEDNNYVKATSDIFIKYMFGMDTRQSKQLVLSFINAVLQDTGFPAITKVFQKNPFNYKEFEGDKVSVLDIEVETENHELYNIEVQSLGNTHYRNRALYYWAKLYTSQISEGEIYERLLPAVSINILDFILLSNLPDYHNFFMLIEGRKKEFALTEHLIIHFLEIPKIDERKISSKITRWLLYLRGEGRDEKMMKILLENDEDLQAAHMMYKAFTNDDTLRRYALGREKAERDRLQLLSSAQKEGMEEGRKEGRKEGEIKGELKEKHTILIRLLELKYTLSEDEKSHILSVTDFKKLDAAIDAVILAEDKESVLRLLK
ncbi:MAG: Rpn family recombination-promoting nuclease/putative transposase [Spirochaetia bacterium]|nr:Rpn family recombination-promoting nuclease/putative transposase [Spirochaetia bacterium]